MDPALALVALTPLPSPSRVGVVARPAATSTAGHAYGHWPGVLLPIVLPLSVLTSEARAELITGRSDLPPDARIAEALLADRPDLALAIASRVRRQGGELGRSLPLLHAWANAEAERLALPRPQDAVLITGSNAGALHAVALDVRLAHEDVAALLVGLPRPLWCGPLILIAGEAPPSLIAATDSGADLVRFALPALVVAPPADLQVASRDRWRGALAARMAVLGLDLAGAPPAGWPAWLRLGLAGVADARTRGKGPSPRDALDRRRAAGAAGLRALCAGATAEAEDPVLATALCTALLQPARRPLLAALLTRLRTGTDAVIALQEAYGMTLEMLADQP